MQQRWLSRPDWLRNLHPAVRFGVMGAIVLLVVALQFVGDPHDPSPEWRRFTPAGASWSIEMPLGVTHRRETAQGVAIEVDSVEVGRDSYGIGRLIPIGDAPVSLESRALGALQQVKAGIERRGATKVTMSRPKHLEGTIAGAPSRRVFAVLTTDDGTIAVNVVVFELDGVVNAITLFDIGEDNSSDTGRCIESIRAA